MPLDDQAAKIVTGGAWAESGDRTDPDDVTLTPVLTRANGWPAGFSTSGGDSLRRRVMNQRFHELDKAFLGIAQEGIPPWDVRIDYPAGALSKTAHAPCACVGGYRASH